MSHRALVYQQLMRFITMAMRGDTVQGAGARDGDGIWSLRRDDGAATHIVRSLAACQSILDDEAFVPAPIGLEIAAAGARADVDLSPVVDFLLENPMQRTGDAHAARRRECLLLYGRTQRRAATGIDALAEAHFEGLQHSPPASLVGDVVEPYVDAVFRQMLDDEEAGGEALYDLVRGTSAALLEYGLNLAQLRSKAEQVSAFMQARCPVTGGDEAERLRSFLLLTFVLQGRDPINGALAAAIRRMLDTPAEARDAMLGEVTARGLFRDAAPVNFIGRSVRSARMVEGVSFSPGDAVLLLLSHANADAIEQNGRGVAFGSGIHSCAGQALSIKVADGYLRALRRYHDRIDWSLMSSGRPITSVFRRYGE